jgi:hypothetical protein
LFDWNGAQIFQIWMCQFDSASIHTISGNARSSFYSKEVRYILTR